MQRRILVIGALGQVGSDLVPALRDAYGPEQVVASDLRPPGPNEAGYRQLDCTDAAALERVIKAERIGCIYHLAALLSNTAEQQPQRAWQLNMGGLFTVLEAARTHGCRLFVPSSIAAFGKDTPLDGTPQLTLQRPGTIYGVTKVAGELLCDYYVARFGMDVRGLRYPGLISSSAPAGGGTTDYAVEIFHHALAHGAYTCYLAPDTRLPMMYMPDAIRAALELMEADAGRLHFHNAYNLHAMSFTPEELAGAIRRRLPGFQVRYEVQPARQAIAESWPHVVDDSAAREDWGWRPAYDLDLMAGDMLDRLSNQGATYACGPSTAAA
jgi:nucleoside-diphosphate-sugar epimerase